MAYTDQATVSYENETDRVRELLRREDTALADMESAIVAERDRLNMRLRDIETTRNAVKSGLERLEVEKAATAPRPY